jgi:predicted nicotinamide N-methyase
MGVTTVASEFHRRIGAYDAELMQFAIGARRVALWRVADLERHVDRAALLGGVDPPEPPYWAHLWTGALLLADAVPRDARTAIELGCGLGLPGLVAACHGARVVFVDRAAAALAFVGASAAANGLGAPALVAADFTTSVLRRRFDLVLAAEVLYDRAAFGATARAIAGLLAPGGRALLTDAGRIDTVSFYEELSAAGLRWRASEQVLREEALPVRVRLVEAVHA